MGWLNAKKGFAEAMLVTIAVLSVLLFAVWQLATKPPEPGADALQQQVDFLASELVALKSRLATSQARAQVLGREAGVLREANRLLREGESERQAELNRLQSELDFYRRLAGTGGAQSGLDVYRAEVLPTESGQVFQFVLTLTQNIRRAAIITGRVRIDLEGIMDDRPVTLYWSQVSDGDTPEPSFRFKYFQQLEGYLTLPAGFSPTRMIVTLEAKDRRKAVERSYVWADLLVTSAD
jgi:hypothetical protein